MMYDTGNKTHFPLPAVAHQCWCWLAFNFLHS